MSWFRNITIRGQLIFASIILLIGFVIIGITYDRAVTAKKEALIKSKSLGKYAVLVEQTHIALLEARRIGVLFKLTKDKKLTSQHEKIMAKVFRLINKLERLSPNKKDKNVIALFRQALAQYETSFKKEVVAIFEIGLTNQKGILGGLNQSAVTIRRLVEKIADNALTLSFHEMRSIEKGYLLNRTNRGLQTWFASIKRFKKIAANLSLPAKIKVTFDHHLKTYQNNIDEFRFSVEDQKGTAASLLKSTNLMVKRLNQTLKHADEIVKLNEQEAASLDKLINIVFLSVLIGIAVIISLAFVLLTRRMGRSLKTLSTTIDQVSDGDYEARTKLEVRDELGALGRSFDHMLDERVNSLAQISRENEQLNNSIVELLEAVSILSDRDLTVSVPIAEDVTGAVGDAINLLAQETAAVLSNIQTIALQVDRSAAIVQEQGNKVTKVADNERKVLEHTVTRLAEGAKTMHAIAETSQTCNSIAADASTSTNLALEAVNDAVTGMSEIREIISETEKRIKRLGERSQEINGIVDIINTVAERTHVLSLNASMQAAAAGEAGRGFAVVADEVQRLAENSRGATSQINDLVNSIQSETAETMMTMNKAISQVVHGSEVTEKAGQQMRDTQMITSRLVSAVGDIAQQSVSQAEVNDDIRQRATLLNKSSKETSEELKQQSEQTEQLVKYAANMLGSVRQFKLPTDK